MLHVIDLDGTVVDCYAWAFMRVRLATHLWNGVPLSPVDYEAFVYNRGIGGLRTWNRKLEDPLAWTLFNANAYRDACVYAGAVRARRLSVASVIQDRVDSRDEMIFVTAGSAIRDARHKVVVAYGQWHREPRILVSCNKRDPWFWSHPEFKQAIVYDDDRHVIEAATANGLRGILVQSQQTVSAHGFRADEIEAAVCAGAWQRTTFGLRRTDDGPYDGEVLKCDP